MTSEIKRIISFKLSGKFAHFSKFYTNSSSLSYLIPPRTAIAGLLASILKIPRDEYYDLMSEDNLKISVRIPEGLMIRKQTHSMNNLHSKYYKLLTTGTGKGDVLHSQCKLELLLGPPDGQIEYIIYIGSSDEGGVISEIFRALKSGNMGYGVYLGQRQFKAEISQITDYKSDSIKYILESGQLDTICLKDNVLDLEILDDYKILVEQIPISFRQIIIKGTKSREPISVKEVIFERSGRQLKGKFKNCYQAGNHFISFY